MSVFEKMQATARCRLRAQVPRLRAKIVRHSLCEAQRESRAATGETRSRNHGAKDQRRRLSAGEDEKPRMKMRTRFRSSRNRQHSAKAFRAGDVDKVENYGIGHLPWVREARKNRKRGEKRPSFFWLQNCVDAVKQFVETRPHFLFRRRRHSSCSPAVHKAALR